MAYLPQIADRIKAWKASGYEIYLVYLPIEGTPKPFVIRALTKKEYESLVEGLNPAAYFPTELEMAYPWPSQFLVNYGTRQYEDILKAGLLWPTLTPEMPAGIDAHIAKHITSVSGWASKGKFVEHLNGARKKASTIWGFLESRIRTAFPFFTDENIQDMTLEAFVHKAAMSELITGVPIDPEPWLDPAAYMAKIEKAEKIAKRNRGETDIDTSGIRDPRMREQIRKVQLAQLAEETKVDLSKRDTRVDFERDNKALAQI